MPSLSIMQVAALEMAREKKIHMSSPISRKATKLGMATWKMYWKTTK